MPRVPIASGSEANLTPAHVNIADVPKCMDHIAQKPNAMLAKKVQTHLRTALRVYFA